MEGEWVGEWWRVGAINEGGRNTLPKIFSGFSEGGCWLIIDRFAFRSWGRVGGIVFDVQIREYGGAGLL